MRAVNEFEGTSYVEAPSLFVELDGDEALASAREILGWEDVVDLEAETTVEALAALAGEAPRRARRRGALAGQALVRDRRLRSALRAAGRGLARAGVRRQARITAAVIAHAADGNFHFVHVVDPDDPDDVAAAQDLCRARRLGARARGTSTGEHGVGVGKIGYLEREHGDLVPYLRALKHVFDPNGILNPGKVVREEVGA